MAKAINAFSGTSSYGVPEHYVQREDGAWFARHYAWNGYGMGMTKWRKLKDDLTAYIKGDILDYGFKPLQRMEHKGLRLPNERPSL